MNTTNTPTSWTENADEIERLTKQRDELATALRNLNETMEARLAECANPSTKTLYAVTEALRSARAALAKVEECAKV